MNRISANTTLFWKIFVPTIYLTIFGIMGLVLLFYDKVEFAFWSLWYIKLSYWLIFTVFVGLLYFTIMDLKRVEVNEDTFMVTNYFKTYRYKLEDIASYHTYDLKILQIHSIHLKSKGAFGHKIRFLPFNVGINSALSTFEKFRSVVGKDQV